MGFWPAALGFSCRRIIVKRNTIVLKSNAYGLTLMLDPEVPFSQLLEDAIEKFKQAEKFFKNAQMAITCKGRLLSDEEEFTLVSALSEYAHIHVVCLVDEVKEHSDFYREAITRVLNQSGEQAHIHQGTVKNGQTVHSDGTLIILGDVNPGGAVSAGGSVIILGCCMGQVTAGSFGRTDAFAAGLVLKPSLLRVGDRAARPAITKRVDRGEYSNDPKIAYIKDGHLVLEPLKGSVFRFLKGEANTLCSDNTDSETTASV